MIGNTQSQHTYHDSTDPGSASGYDADVVRRVLRRQVLPVQVIVVGRDLVSKLVQARDGCVLEFGIGNAHDKVSGWTTGNGPRFGCTLTHVGPFRTVGLKAVRESPARRINDPSLRDLVEHVKAGRFLGFGNNLLLFAVVTTGFHRRVRMLMVLEIDRMCFENAASAALVAHVGTLFLRHGIV